MPHTVITQPLARLAGESWISWTPAFANPFVREITVPPDAATGLRNRHGFPFLKLQDVFDDAVRKLAHRGRV
jgi:hypothetical protein